LTVFVPLLKLIMFPVVLSSESIVSLGSSHAVQAQATECG
jgi:hypothetical protein